MGLGQRQHKTAKSNQREDFETIGFWSSPTSLPNFKVEWDQLASSVGPQKNIANGWWASAAKRHWSHLPFA